MTQHFLLSAAAKTLTLASVARMSDEDAHEAFSRIRWSDNEGKPYCPKCGCVAVYTYEARRIYKCKGCGAQFSATSGTIFASRKLAVRDYLLAIAIFMNGAKGHSALQLSRDLGVQYKTAFVLAHKLREAMAASMPSEKVTGHVEIDGGYFGGYVKPANMKEHRLDRRSRYVQNGKRQCVVIMRERDGKSLPFVCKAEADAIPAILAHVDPNSTVFADEASCWDQLHARYLTKRINHSVEYANGDTNTNQAESFFSRLRRAEIGTHHKVAGPYLTAYADEMAWREDNRRISNGEQFMAVVNAAAKHPVSENWKGYWQRSWRNA